VQCDASNATAKQVNLKLRIAIMSDNRSPRRTFGRTMPHQSHHHFEFVCVDCAARVIRWGEFDAPPLCCAGCAYIREHPDIPDHVRDVLRGDY
jgi:hypothetical protein